MNGVICKQCIDVWDLNGPDFYKGMTIHTVVVVDGTSMCLSHYRLWRDGIDPNPEVCGVKPLGACTKQAGHEGGHRYRAAPEKKVT